MKQVKIGAIYHQMAQEKSKKKGQHIESYLNDLIAADYQKRK
tara:strand:- start:432 stop:557 length:126 start_codon:yes stop_codon:yes gene_type:complete